MANILIIDDDPVFSDMTKQRLERAGHHVALHIGPFGATAVACDPSLDLIIIDVFMPGLSGPDVLGVMRKNARVRAPVIFCSSMDDAPLRQLAKEHGAIGHISKSTERAEFVETVGRVLARARRAAL